MTATLWQVSENLDAMFRLLGERINDRKLRLFACACCRRISPVLPEGPIRAAIEVGEGFVDGQATEAELASAWQALFDLLMTLRQEQPLNFVLSMMGSVALKAVGRRSLRHPGHPSVGMDIATAISSHTCMARVSQTSSETPLGAVKESPAWGEEFACQAALIRCLFRNPFLPVTPAASWKQWSCEATRAFARAMYDQHNFGRAAELATLLEEAGCTDLQALEHLRGPGPHARGCWVLDAILFSPDLAEPLVEVGPPAPEADLSRPSPYRHDLAARMTEQEWRVCRTGLRMILAERPDESYRKKLLIVAACCRQFASRELIDLPPSIRSFAEARISSPPRVTIEDVEQLAEGLPNPFDKLKSEFGNGPAFVNGPPGFVIVSVGPLRDRSHSLTAACEEDFVADLFREVVGNPFRPLPVLPSSVLTWNDGAVVKMARCIYDERAWDRLPILADALEDAGCDDAELLGHLRGPGPHARGCFALDAVLGRS